MVKIITSKNKLSLSSDIILIKVTRNGKNKKIEYSLIKKTKKIEFKKRVKRNRFFILSAKLFPKNLKL